MHLRLASERSVAVGDGPGLVRALARLVDTGQLRLDPDACDSATVHRVKDALHAVLDDRLLLALQALLDALEAGRGGVGPSGEPD